MRPEKLLLVALIGLIVMYAVLRSEAHENDRSNSRSKIVQAMPSHRSPMAML